MTEFIAGAMMATGILLTGIFAGLKIERERTMTAIRKHLESEGEEWYDETTRAGIRKHEDCSQGGN